MAPPTVGIRLIVAYKLVRGGVAFLIAFALGTASLWGGGAWLRDLADTIKLDELPCGHLRPQAGDFFPRR